MASTTIQVPTELKERLAALKTHPRQAYAEVIAEALDWLAEDDAPLSAATEKALDEARAELEAGGGASLADVRAELGL